MWRPIDEKVGRRGRRKPGETPIGLGQHRLRSAWPLHWPTRHGTSGLPGRCAGRPGTASGLPGGCTGLPSRCGRPYGVWPDWLYAICGDVCWVTLPRLNKNLAGHGFRCPARLPYLVLGQNFRLRVLLVGRLGIGDPAGLAVGRLVLGQDPIERPARLGEHLASRGHLVVGAGADHLAAASCSWCTSIRMSTAALAAPPGSPTTALGSLIGVGRHVGSAFIGEPVRAPRTVSVLQRDQVLVFERASAGYTDPGLGCHRPPLRSPNRRIIW